MDRTFSRPNRTCGLGGEGVLMWGLLSSLFHMKSRSPGSRVDPLLAPSSCTEDDSRCIISCQNKHSRALYYISEKI